MSSSSQFKVYSWEQPQAPSWEEWTQNTETSGLLAWNKDSDESEEEQLVPGEELAAYLQDQQRLGLMTAKQVCVVSFWANKAGVEAVAPMSLPPDTKGTGDFKRLLDSVTKSDARDTYVLILPANVRSAGGRAPFALHVLLPHEVLQEDMEKRNMHSLQQSWQQTPNYRTHPVVVAANNRGDGRPVVPVSLFVDGVSYAKRDSLLVISVHNLWTGSRFTVAVLRKRLLCRCSCRGWDTLHCFFVWLRWCLHVLREGRYPGMRHDNEPWTSELDKKRAAQAGGEMPFLAAVVQLRADWAEIAHTLAVPHWASANHPCFLCYATRATLYGRLAECNGAMCP